MKYVYVGVFLKKENLMKRIENLGSRLSKGIEFPHITFQFRPENVNEKLFGSKIIVKAIGYGNNGKNEGLKVELSSTNPELQSMIEAIEVPHITLSISDDGKPVDTRFLSFEDIEPFEICGTFGGFANGKVFTCPSTNQNPLK